MNNKSQDQQGQSSISPQSQNFREGIITAHLATALATVSRSISSNQPVPQSDAKQIKSALDDYQSYCAANGMTFKGSIEQ